MTDPLSGKHHRLGTDGDAVREIIRAHLIDCRNKGVLFSGCSGASFVTTGIEIWAAELAEVDAHKAKVLLRALSEIIDPNTTAYEKSAAEVCRQFAIENLHSAFDLAMNKSEGGA